MIDPRPVPGRAIGTVIRGWLIVFVLLATARPLLSQEDGDGSEEVQLPPSGRATLVDARGETTISLLELPAGPLFALLPIASRLGVPLEVGPLGDRHQLTVRDQRFIVGPNAASMVVIGDGDEELVPLSQPPRRNLEGLNVPLDFLERSLGDGLGFDVRWDSFARRLDIERREERELGARLLQVRQGPVTTVEVSFSQTPRYRVDRRPDGLDIQLLGDRLALGAPFAGDASDPLVEGVVVEPTRLRIYLAPDAAAAEPRLLGAPPRLIVEVFRRRTARSADDDTGRQSAPAARGGLHTIVIDPGHGGVETGAISQGGLVEKDLTLWFAGALARQLERRLPVRVLLTRDRDVDIPLDSRTAFANQQKADLFISLHLNSWFGRGARGAESYFLSRSATDERAAESAARENQAVAASAGDPELGLELILWDLAQSHHLAESQRFANLVQEELNASLGLENRGVKQAPFRVLVGAAMPAVVVELGFLSNPEEAAKLQDPAHRGELVEALVRAVVRFKMQLDASPADSGGVSAPAPGAEP